MRYSAILSLEQAAARLATTPLNVLLHIKRGRLVGMETPAGWQVTMESLAGLLEQQTDRGTALCRSACSGCSTCPE